ncbi:MAG: hypothetical protein FJ042_02780 [Candidatus Cloacimonetes bacterium]|nr:hypothetical protein [Candidatus Cloacimonadota bacterium]
MKTILITLAAVLSAGTLSAGNSVFSSMGFPYQYYGADAYGLTMGETGLADVFRKNTGYANPAMHNLSNKMLISTGLMFGYSYYEMANGEGAGYTDNSLDLPFFSISAPFRKHRLGLQFNSYASGNLRNELRIDSLGIVEKHEFDKYIYRADVVYSYNLGRLKLGISGNYLFGHDDHYFTQEGQFGVFNTKEILRRNFKNPTVTAGILTHWERWSMGAYYTAGTVLKGDLVRSSIHETESAEDYEYELPPHIAAGVTVIPVPTVKISADIHYDPWSTVDENRYENSYRIAIGVAYEPVWEIGSSALSAVPWRMGASYRRLPFHDKDSNTIAEYSVSCGMSLPLSRDANQIDLGFIALRRGALSSNTLQETSLMFVVGITGFDILTREPTRTAPRYIPKAEELAN